MPVHDWSRVEAGMFHHFHHSWIEETMRTLNRDILPPEYYAMSEQHAAGFGPDVLALQHEDDSETAQDSPYAASNGSTLLLDPPKVQATAETDMEFYRRKQNKIVVRHVSGDKIIAMVEIVSQGNKSSRHAMRSFVEKAAELLENRIHLLILDLHPPGKLDPQGIHGAIWEDICGQQYIAPPDKPLTLVAYETALSTKAYVEPIAVGDTLIDMPLFLKPGGHVLVPLEDTYQRAFAAVPRRWRVVLESGE